MVIFSDGEDTEVHFAESVLTPVAEAYYEKFNINFSAQQDENCLYNWEDDSYLQFLIGSDNEASDIIRDLIGLDDVVPLLIVLDIPSRRFVTMEYGVEITVSTVTKFVDEFRRGELSLQCIDDKVSEADNFGKQTI